ncbi:MAG: TonB-dependent receptor [Bacteroidia bacterium]|nr:TonB-dependent receptor [Bacteroidia bacterium]
MKIKFLFFCFAVFTLLVSYNSMAEDDRYSLSGYIKDAKTGEVLLYANVVIAELKTGASTNQYGYYSLKVPAGNYTIQYSYLGYETVSRKISLKSNINADIELVPKYTSLNAVEITGKSEKNSVRSLEMSAIQLDIKQLKAIPLLFGERDILKSIQLLPGVSPGSEGSSNYFVRGGEADQNHILLDEAPVYNASHLMGFFSVFNSDAIKDVKLYKGGIPAPYGGRVSSVLDIRMRDGNSKEWGVSGGIGLISSRLTIEGPLVKDKGSIMISGRRTYADVAVKAVSNKADSTTFYFYDFNLKANYILGVKDRLYLSGYIGRDIFGRKQIGFDSGNATLTLRWNHTFNQELFLNTSLIYSDYNYGFKASFGANSFKLTSGILDYSIKQDYTWYPNTNNMIRFGLNSAYHQFKPGNFTSGNESDTTGILSTIQPQQALESGVYISNEHKISETFSMNYGLRLSLFNNIGPYSVKSYNSNKEIIDSTAYSNGKIYNTYVGFEPRITANYLLNSTNSIKASYNRMFQYLHILSNSISSSPTDIWAPSTPLIKPTIADQVALGYFKNLPKKNWDLSVEAYYKILSNLVDYKNGANTFLNPDLEAELEFGRGRAYGVEFAVSRNSGKLTGWVSYTLSKSEKQFDQINFGKWFSARQDRTHNISIVATYQLTDRFAFSGNWIYYTGDAVTFPSGKYLIDSALINLYTERNGSRMPNYHRLDLGITYQFKPKRRWSSDINVSVYNVYDRKNAYSISFRESETVPGTTEAVRLALFGIVPSITWNFKF